MENILLKTLLPLDGPWRVDNYGSRVIPARIKGGFEELSLVDYPTLAYHFSFENLNGWELVESTLRRISEKLKSSVELTILERADIFTSKSNLLNLDSYSECIDYSYQNNSDLTEILNEVLAKAKSVVKTLDSRSVIFPTNKKYELIVVPYFAKDMANTNISKVLEELRANLYRSKINLLLIGDAPTAIPDLFEYYLEWQCFLGKDYESHAIGKTGLKPVRLTESITPIGVALRRFEDSEELKTIGNLRYNPTQDTIRAKEDLIKEEEEYLKFLSELREI